MFQQPQVIAEVREGVRGPPIPAHRVILSPKLEAAEHFLP